MPTAYPVPFSSGPARNGTLTQLTLKENQGDLEAF